MEKFKFNKSISNDESTTVTEIKNRRGLRSTLMIGVAAGALVLAGCASKADRASENLSTAADNFEIDRRIVFINGITDSIPLSIEGRCSIEVDDADSQLEVTCKIGEDESGDNLYYKHFLGLSDNMTYVVEQVEGADVDVFSHRVIFRPESIIPNFDLDTTSGEN